LGEWEEFQGYVFGLVAFDVSFLHLSAHAALSSNNIIGSLSIGNSQVAWLCWVIYLSYTYSQLASWSAMNSAWLEKVMIIVYFCKHQEIDVPPHVNTFYLRSGFMWIWQVACICITNHFLFWPFGIKQELFLEDNEIYT